MKDCIPLLFVVVFLSQKELSVTAFAIPPPLVEFTVGAIAGGAGAFAAYPFDYIKSQMQTEHGKENYKNGFDCLKNTLAQGGPLLLYRGAGITSLGNAPEKALKLNSHDFAKSMIISSNGGTVTVGIEILAGIIAGVVQVILTSPLETVKVGLQTSELTLEEVMEEIGGLPGLFKGAEACIARDIIFNAMLFPVYSHMRIGMPDYLAGAIAGVMATFVATPTDVVKTRILSQDKYSRGRRSGVSVTSFAPSSQPRLATATAMAAMKNDDTESEVYCESYSKYRNDDYLIDRNPFVVAYKISEREGPKVLFSGVFERCVGSVPRFGLTLSLHDVLKTISIQHHWM